MVMVLLAVVALMSWLWLWIFIVMSVVTVHNMRWQKSVKKVRYNLDPGRTTEETSDERE